MLFFIDARKLPGSGDILFGNKTDGYKQIQASLVTDKEVNKVTDFLKAESISSKDILADE